MICLYFPFPCVYREKATPSSIPNLAVKLLFADDTAPFRCGNVGRCRDREILLFTYFFTSLYRILLFAFGCLIEFVWFYGFKIVLIDLLQRFGFLVSY